MNGLPTFEQKLRRMRRAQTRPVTPATKQLTIGSWAIEEDDQGNLVIRHTQTGQKTLLDRPIKGE